MSDSTTVTMCESVSVYKKAFDESVLTASIRILGPLTHSTFSLLLDSHKVLLSHQGLHRDWRGLAEFSRLDAAAVCAASRISCTSHCLHLWGQAGGRIEHVVQALQAMDRHDVLLDTKQLIEKDYKRVKQNGLAALPPSILQQPDCEDEAVLTVHDRESLLTHGGVTQYDALLLHSDAEADMKFVQTLLEKLEGQYNLKICVKDRDLVGGLQFESDSVVRLITERCSHVIVLITKAFLASPLNNFFTLFAHSLSIEQRRRIVVPCMLEPCTKPAVISFCHSLDYFRANGYWDYWEKLRDSVARRPTLVAAHSSARITELTDTAAHRLRLLDIPTTTTSLQPRQTDASSTSHQPRQTDASSTTSHHPRIIEAPTSTTTSSSPRLYQQEQCAATQKALAAGKTDKRNSEPQHPSTRVRTISSTLLARLRLKTRTGTRSASESQCTRTTSTSSSSLPASVTPDLAIPPPSPRLPATATSTTTASTATATTSIGPSTAAAASTACATSSSCNGTRSTASDAAISGPSPSLSQQLQLLPDPPRDAPGSPAAVAAKNGVGGRVAKFFKKTKRRVKLSV